jgi:hypothetical protein
MFCATWGVMHPPQFSNEFLGVVVLVASQGHALSGWQRFRHEQRNIPLHASTRLAQKGLQQ